MSLEVAEQWCYEGKGKKIMKRGDVNKFANLTPYILGYDFLCVELNYFCFNYLGNGDMCSCFFMIFSFVNI